MPLRIFPGPNLYETPRRRWITSRIKRALPQLKALNVFSSRSRALKRKKRPPTDFDNSRNSKLSTKKLLPVTSLDVHSWNAACRYRTILNNSNYFCRFAFICHLHFPFDIPKDTVVHIFNICRNKKVKIYSLVKSSYYAPGQIPKKLFFCSKLFSSRNLRNLVFFVTLYEDIKVCGTP